MICAFMKNLGGLMYGHRGTKGNLFPLEKE